MGREVEEEEEEKWSPPPVLERKNRSLRSKAAHFVSDLTTVILNPISDKPSKRKPRPPPVPVSVSSLLLCFVLLVYGCSRV